jgi:hypothetical protein
MNYTTRFERFRDITSDHAVQLANAKVKWSEGPSMQSSAGTNSPRDLLRMIRYARQRGANGACVFCFNPDTPEEYVEALGEFSRV